MNNIVHFSPELAKWIEAQLNCKCAPETLVEAMVAGRMELQVAQAIVSVFVKSHRLGAPFPVDSIEMETVADYRYETPVFNHGSRIVTPDRVVRIAARTAKPVAAVLIDMLSAQECEQLIALAKPRLTPSTVVAPYSGNNIIAPYRNSLGMFFRLQENPFIAQLEERISAVNNLPIGNGEGIQVLYYPTGTLNTPHFDYLMPTNPANVNSLARSGQRVSTILMYLNDVEEGGETTFPEVGWAVSPQRGNAVYFEYCNSHNQVDPLSLHSSNPVMRGEKWVAVKWSRQSRFISANEVVSEGMML